MGGCSRQFCRIEHAATGAIMKPFLYLEFAFSDLTVSFVWIWQ